MPLVGGVLDIQQQLADAIKESMGYSSNAHVCRQQQQQQQSTSRSIPM